MKNVFYHNEHSFALAAQLDALQRTILKRWQEDRVVRYVLGSRGIDIKFFVRFFGSKVLEYFVKVLKNEEKIGECPIIIVMVRFFSEKDLTLQDLFLCCAGFKNCVTNVFLEDSLKEQKQIDPSRMRALQVVFDLNFSGVIQEYIDHGYCIRQCPEKLGLVKKMEAKKIEMDEVELQLQEEVLSEASTDESALITDSEEYEHEEIQEFYELEEEITYHANFLHDDVIEYETCLALSSRLTKYANTILINPNFSDLGESVFALAHMFSNHSYFDSISEHKSAIALLVDCFLNDLACWKDSLLVTRIKDPHYYDQSIISSAQQIIMIATQENSGEEVEFF